MYRTQGSASQVLYVTFYPRKQISSVRFKEEPDSQLLEAGHQHVN